MIIKALIHLFLFCNVLFIGYLVWWYWHHRIVSCAPNVSARFIPATRDTAKYRLALICPRKTPSLRRLIAGLELELNSHKTSNYYIEVMEGHHLNRLTRYHANNILEDNYDCIISSGVFSTQIMQEFIAQSQRPRPLVFGSIAESENHIVQHPVAHTWTTGVLHERDLTTEIAQIAALVPNMKNVLIIKPNLTLRWLNSHIKQLTTYLETHNHQHAIHRMTKTIDPVLQKLTDVSMVIVLAYAMQPEDMITLAAACSAQGIVLYSNDIDAVEYGAVIGSGGGEHSTGRAMARKIRLIIEEKIPTHHVPISTHTPPSTIRVNRAMLDTQPLQLSDNDLFVISQGESMRSSAL